MNDLMPLKRGRDGVYTEALPSGPESGQDRSMSPVPEHPIATPRGAAAFAVVVGVAGVFGPLFLDARGAVAFGALACAVIAWIYLREAKDAWRGRRWHSGLLLPLVFLVAVGSMTGLAARKLQQAKSPTVPALSADDIAKRVIAMMPKPKPIPEMPPAQPPQPAIRAPTSAPTPERASAVNCKTEFPYIGAAYSGMKDGVPKFGISVNYSGRIRQHNVAFEFMSITKDKPMVQPRDFTVQFLDPGSQSYATPTPLFEFGDYDVHIRSDECDLWERMSLAPASNDSVSQKIVIVENGHTVKTIE